VEAAHERDHQRAMARIAAAGARMDRSDKRMEASDRKFERRMQAHGKRMEAAEKRAEKFDQQIRPTHKLMEAGIKLASQLAAETRELKRSQKAFLDSLHNRRKGHAKKS